MKKMVPPQTLSRFSALSSGWSGENLSAFREAKGITVKKLSEATRIKQSIIRAIEMEYHEVLPRNPVVLQSFVKQIVAFLSVSS